MSAAPGGVAYHDPAIAARLSQQAVLADPGPLQALVVRALDAAQSAGAHYADVRLTRSVGHVYKWQTPVSQFAAETEVQGFGVRALVNGYWGFAAAAVYDAEAVVRLAQDAVTQATINATISHAAQTGQASRTVRSGGGLAQTVELAPAPVVTGTWATPVVIDPFTVPVEEKLDTIASWDTLATQSGFIFPTIFASSLTFVREEHVLGTTEGTLVTQTTYQTGGNASLKSKSKGQPTLTKLDMAGRGWELVLDADIPGQIEAFAVAPPHAPERAKAAQVGRYPIVCDGATMAALLDATLALATQVDRALGYEANASGTSYLNDPLGMLGTYQTASPLVTVTANRSAPTQLATVRWDAEGVVPEDVTLIKQGVLVEYQTTREQASWLAPYYRKAGKPVRSHGYAGAENALVTPLQMLPNVVLAPSPEPIRLEDLTASVRNGFLITDGTVTTDFQGRTGTLHAASGAIHEIANGRVGKMISGGAVQFDSPDLWKKITALGGATTVASTGHGSVGFIYGGVGSGTTKGEPAQSTPYTVQAAATLIQDQAVIATTRMGR
jgi:TldD protein